MAHQESSRDDRGGPARPVTADQRPPTLATVAGRAGVSVSTASLVFSGAGPVSPATRTRVLTAAAELDYAGPDPRGRSLRRGRSGIIAAVLEESVRYAFRDPVKIAYLDGIAAEVAAAGLALLLVPDASDGPATLETAAADAAILIGCSPNVERTVAQGRRRNLPMIAMGSAAFADVPTVTLNDRTATRELARGLSALGHRRVAMVALAMDSSHRRGSLTAEWERGATVHQALERLEGAREIFPDLRVEVAAGSLVDEGRLAGRKLLGEPGTDDGPGPVQPGSTPPVGRPTAVIAQSDLLAAGVILAATELGLSVPDDLSVVGFDGVRIDSVIPHDLTTAVQPATEQGRAAARMALAMIDGSRPDSMLFTTQVHQGATTAPPPGDHGAAAG